MLILLTRGGERSRGGVFERDAAASGHTRRAFVSIELLQILIHDSDLAHCHSVSPSFVMGMRVRIGEHSSYAEGEQC
jgi:hypothetical protein